MVSYRSLVRQPFPQAKKPQLVVVAVKGIEEACNLDGAVSCMHRREEAAPGFEAIGCARRRAAARGGDSEGRSPGGVGTGVDRGVMIGVYCRRLRTTSGHGTCGGDGGG